MSSLPTPLALCFYPWCSRPATQACRTCRWILFCSTACEERARTIHQRHCYRFAEAPRPVGPESGLLRRAFLFHAGSYHISAIYPKCIDGRCFVEDCLVKSHPDSCTNPWENNIRWITIPSQGSTSPIISLAYCDRFLKSHGYSVNHTIDRVADGRKNNCWRGPVVATMHRITDSGATEFIDVENGDLKLIIAALAPLDPPTFDGYGVWAAVRKRQSALRCEPPLNVPCVRIHCNGEVTRSRWPHYAQAFIPSWDVPRSEVILQISSRIGLPLYAKQERLDPAKWSDLDRESMNSVVLGLFLELDPSVPYWGTIPNRWFAHTGNVLLARQDGEDLSVEDAERVCKFAQDVIGPLVIAARELGCPPGSKEELLASITPEKFAEFCETYEIEAVADRLKRKRESSKRYRAAKIAEKARAGAEQDARLLASEDIDTEGTDVKREEGVKEEEDVEQMQKFEEEDDAEQVKEQAEREIVIKPEPTD